jgi:hydroxyacylglutathione hydrolase
MEAWPTSKIPLQTIQSLTLAQVTSQLRADGVTVLDVRGEEEWKSGHLPGSLNIPIGSLDGRVNQIPRDHPVIVHCQTGARAAIAASLLCARGLSDVRVFTGGFAQWRSAGQVVEPAP